MLYVEKELKGTEKLVIKLVSIFVELIYNESAVDILKVLETL